MKYAIDGHQCPNCGAVLKVLQSPWPYTGEWVPYRDPEFCAHCGARMDWKGGGRCESHGSARA